MEATEDIVIVGAGIAGLTTALGLHRLGIRSLVLESSEELRTTGFALGTWPNAWKALDAVGVGDSLRRQHCKILGFKMYSTLTGQCTAQRQFGGQGKTQEEFDTRCVQRKHLLETLARELLPGTIRYSSKVVSIEELGHLKLVHLADGSVLKAKVLIGCDGVNSAVAKWLGLGKPIYTGRAAIRGCVYYNQSHGLEPISMRFCGGGVRLGLVPCDDTTVYWFFTWYPSPQDKEMEDDTAKMKQFVLTRLGKVPDHVREVFERTELGNIVMSLLRYRHPWEVAWRNISKGTVCVAGDAFHPMTPDLAQGGCSALEDGVVLARCLGQALKNNNNHNSKEMEEEERKRIETGLENYARERRWRGFELITTAFMVGYIQQSDGKILSFLRDQVLPGFLAGRLVKMASFDCGKLSSS